MTILGTQEASLQTGGAVLNSMSVIEEGATALTESFREKYHG